MPSSRRETAEWRILLWSVGFLRSVGTDVFGPLHRPTQIRGEDSRRLAKILKTDVTLNFQTRHTKVSQSVSSSGPCGGGPDGSARRFDGLVAAPLCTLSLCHSVCRVKVTVWPVTVTLCTVALSHSHCHTVTLSLSHCEHCHWVSSHCHTVPVHTVPVHTVTAVTLSLFLLSHCRTVTLRPVHFHRVHCRTVALSVCQSVKQCTTLPVSLSQKQTVSPAVFAVWL